MKINKKIVIYIVIAIIIIIGILVFIKNSKKSTEEGKTIKIVDISEVFEVDNIEKSKYEIEKQKDLQIASKYIVGKEKYQLKNNVRFVEQIGTMIYIRESYNKLNIYQTEYKIDEYDNISFQVEQIIEQFKAMSIDFIGTEPTEEHEELIGDDIKKLTVPVGESIYYKNSQYTSNYKVNEIKNIKEYEINVYRKDERIICELVSIL